MIKKNQIKDGITFLAKPIAQSVLDKRIRENNKYFWYVKNKKIRKNTFLLESYHASNTTGNVYAIFKKLIDRKPDAKYYWVSKKSNDNQMLSYLKADNVEIVEYESSKYYKLLATCEYLLNDTSFMPYFIKRDNQIYINTWHGTPLKTLGKDIKNVGAHGHKNIQRNLLQTDILLMPNLFTANKLLRAHNLDGIFKGKVFITGNARVDNNWSSIEKMKQKYKLSIDKKIILFAPTWKKSIEETTEDDILSLIDEVNKLQNSVSSEYKVMLKAHYFIYDRFVSLGLGDKIIPNWVDTNELLAITDKLITDYSSIFFDYLPLNKPVYFYIPDKDIYERTRGFYLDINKIPGSLSMTLDDVIFNLNKNNQEYLEEFKEQRANYLSEFCYLDDGNASERAVDIILNNNESEIKMVTFDSGKEIILLYAGGLYNNGITSSLINLSKNLDYSKYELVIIESNYMHAAKFENMKKIDSRARFIFHFSHISRTFISSYNQNMFYRQGINSKFISKKSLKIDIDLEWKRTLGNLKPDYAVDFGGYNKVFNSMFALGDFNKKSVYLHSLMLEEYNKVVNKRYTHRWNLKVIFSMYNFYDNIVSVSESSYLQNSSDLLSFGVDNKKMTYINNILDFEGIKEKEFSYKKINNGKMIESSIDGKLRVPYTESINKFGIQTLISIDVPKKENVNFVNVGRLSPEKNHLNLLRAFSEVYKRNKNIRLFLVGDGPLLTEIINEIEILNLRDVVFLLGQLSNPIPIIGMCDCLISSSNYEGQGLVLLEAMVLKKPVLGTNVIGNKSVLEKYPKSLIENTHQGLVEGIQKFLQGEVGINNFNPEEYNQIAMDSFYRIIV